MRVIPATASRTRESDAATPSTRGRILVFCAHFRPSVGGVERFTEELFSRLTQRGWSVRVVTSRTHPNPPDAPDLGFEVKRLPVLNLMDGRLPVILPTATVARVVNGARRWSPDVVVTNTRFFSTSLLGVELARRLAVPSLHIEHGSEHVRSGRRVSNTISKALDHTMGAWVIRRATRCVGVSQAVADFVGHLGRQDCGVLHNGVDSAAFRRGDPDWRDRRRIPPDVPLILYVGRLFADKGVETLAGAFAKLDGSGAHLCLVGDGPLLPFLRAKLGTRSDVHLLGSLPHSEVPAALGACDIFVHPSRCAEGLPTSVLEAGAAGVAVVATPMGGTVEILPSPQHGILVEPGDEASLAAALSRLVASPEERERMGRTLNEHVRAEFDWVRIADDAEREVRALLAGREVRG